MSLMYNYARSEDKPYAHNGRILMASSAYRTVFFDKTSVSSAAAKNNHAKTERQHYCDKKSRTKFHCLRFGLPGTSNTETQEAT